ncbi:VOC family protein [Haloferax namakaokahaiae]|uniref:VOC family protein n=1 Tax=Haloferax namakaokahaiae TaxID=1748331 RepID=A0ABD5ZBM4_9EURY
MSDPDVYPMPLFVQLAVSNVGESVAWYSALGFETIYEMPTMAHVRREKYADVMLVADRGIDADRRGAGVRTYVTVERDELDDIAARASEQVGETIDPEPTAWNTREVSVTDPDGYELVFSAVVDADRTFADVMGEETP